MIILGNKYTFTNLELQRLEKKFTTINKISYKGEKPKDVIAQIEANIQSKTSIIVLNTKAKVDDEIIKYLTNLKFNPKHTTLKIISIEHFLEQYLFKCYIPEDNDDLHYLDDIHDLSFFQKFQKVLIDAIAVIGLFIIFIIVKPFVKKKIRQESPGDIYFKQLRVGQGNKEFKCIKFRSMNLHDSDNHVKTAVKNDDRIFPFGETMRKTRIDEIPQVFNIIKGEISLIGPRAEWNKLVSEYENEIPYYNQRHIIKPGITGWAQVMFVEGRSKEDTRQKLMYDLYYIKYWSLWLDIQVIYKTILIVLARKGI